MIKFLILVFEFNDQDSGCAYLDGNGSESNQDGEYIIKSCFYMQFLPFANISDRFTYAFVDMNVDNIGASELSVQNREILLELAGKRKKLKRLEKKVVMY